MMWKSVVSILLFASVVTAAEMPFEGDPEEYFGGIGNNAGYLDWVESQEQPYERSLFMPYSDASGGGGSSSSSKSNTAADIQEGTVVHWTIDEDNEMIRLAVVVAGDVQGWVAFGIAESGGMLGADMVVYTVATDSIQDMYTLADRQPWVDDCQDWTSLGSHQTDDGFLIFEVERKLDTGDSQDRKIVDDGTIDMVPHRIITAWGDQEELGFHGLQYTRSAVRFFGQGDETDRFLKQMDEVADGYFEVRAQNYTIKPIDTEYQYFCVSEAEVIAQGVPMNESTISIVGYMPVFTSGYVHHALAYGGVNPESDCAGRPRDAEAIFGYAPGAGPYSPPFNVGGPLGQHNFGHRSFLIEVHYSNPAMIQGDTDSSGVRLYWSRTPRQFQMGAAVMGDPSTSLAGTKVGNDDAAGIFHHSFTCPSQCSSLAAEQTPTTPITVHQQYLHMHEVGIRAKHSQIRNGKVVHDAHVDFWQFSEQGNLQVQDVPYELQPGDEFKTECWYETKGNETFGFGHSNEMCAVIMYYYPRVFLLGQFPWYCGYDLGFPACNVVYESEAVEDGSDLGRAFGAPGGCTAPPSAAPSSRATEGLNGESLTPNSPTKAPTEPHTGTTADSSSDEPLEEVLPTPETSTESFQSSSIMGCLALRLWTFMAIVLPTAFGLA